MNERRKRYEKNNSPLELYKAKKLDAAAKQHQVLEALPFLQLKIPLPN